MYETIHVGTEAIKPKLVATRRDFHANAETGWFEMRTSSIIARRLTELGYEVLTGEDVCDAKTRMGVPSAAELDAHYEWAKSNGADPEFLERTRGGFTGVIGILRCGEGKTLAMRFDIDALGVLESDDATHLPTAQGFASRTRGVMHACGHDGHAAVGLGTAEMLMQVRDELHGTVKLIFQPAEEGVRGAKSIVEKGHLDGVDYVIAAHIGGSPSVSRPMVGRFAKGGGGLATSKIDARFCGLAAHAGMAPQRGHNAMLAAATAVLNLNAIPRFGDVPTLLNVGRLTAGTGRNVVCDRALLEMEVRGRTSEANAYMEEYAMRILRAAAAMHGCTVETEFVGSAPAFDNTEALSDRIASVARNALGIPVVEFPGLGGGSDDYAYYMESVQAQGGEGCYFSLVTPCPAVPHSARFDFGEDVLAMGVEVFVAAACDLLK